MTSLPVHGVAVTNLDRPLYPGLTKRDLIAYYEAVAPHMLPHAVRRPLTLRRCPRGVAAPCFIQQHDTGNLPEAIRAVPIVEENGRTRPHLYIEDLSGLVAGVQMAVLELHGWGARVDGLDAPDRLVFDLDPDPRLPFRDVMASSRAIRDRLAAHGVASWPLLTGGKGIHVVVPLAAGQDWSVVSAFARSFAQRLADDEPDAYVAAMPKARRTGRVFIDWLRNVRGATAILPFSTRARIGAPVAMPVDWDGLDTIGGAAAFTVRRVIEDRPMSPADWCAVPQRLP